MATLAPGAAPEVVHYLRELDDKRPGQLHCRKNKTGKENGVLAGHSWTVYPELVKGCEDGCKEAAKADLMRREAAQASS